MKSEQPRARFGFHLVGLARRWRRHLDEQLAANGLSDASWVPLVHLDEMGGGLHQKDLAAAIGLDGSSLVRLIDILEKLELVERRVDENDRRARRIWLTPEGRRRVAAVRETLRTIEEDLLRDCDDARLETALQVFGHIEQRLQHHRENSSPEAGAAGEKAR